MVWIFFHRKVRQVAEVVREIESCESRDARDSEVAERLGISLSAYHQILQDASGHKIFSMEELVAGADSVSEGVIPKDQTEDLVCVCGVFIHPAAEDDEKIYNYNYEAVKQSLANAMSGKPTADDMIAKKDSAAHPFRGF